MDNAVPMHVRDIEASQQEGDLSARNTSTHGGLSKSHLMSPRACCMISQWLTIDLYGIYLSLLWFSCGPHPTISQTVPSTTARSEHEVR